jgi:hypothetical protein
MPRLVEPPPHGHLGAAELSGHLGASKALSVEGDHVVDVDPAREAGPSSCDTSTDQGGVHGLPSNMQLGRDLVHPLHGLVPADDLRR